MQASKEATCRIGGSMKERIIQLLGNGVSPAIAASAVGCSEGYISQLMSDEAVAARVSELRFSNLQAASDRDKKADTIEDALLGKLQEALPMMMRPAEIVRSLAVVNALKRRASSAPETMHIHNQVINLQLPQHTALRVQMSASKEIVEVEGRTLVTMPSTQLLLEAKQHANLRNQVQGEALPGAADSKAA
jgi:hypothetical protein